MRSANLNWKRAVTGLFVLAVLCSTAQALAYRYMQGQLLTELRQAEAVRDHAVRELGALALEAVREREARAEQAAAYEAAGAWRYAGEFTVTAYCPCAECCGRWADGVTASGLPAGPGIVAVDKSVIPLGSTVILDGLRYLAADTGVTGDRIDICLTSHQAAEDFGVERMEVWVEACT